MTPKPSSDTGFQIVTTAEPGYDAFRIALAMSTVKPGTAVPAGTTYTAAVLPEKFRINEGWADYVAGRREVADDGHLWQNFVRALPTTPTVAEGEFHPIFGRTYVHTYDDLIANSRPDRGDVIDVASGAALEGWNGTASTGALYAWDGSAQGAALATYDVRVVLDCTENDLGQGLCEVKVRSVGNAQVIITDDEGVDEDSGVLDTVEKTHTLTGTRPESAATDATGYYTLVTRQDHNWFVSTRRKASLLPTSEAEALTETKVERSDVYWPPVLKSAEFLAVLDQGLDYWHKDLNTLLQDAYTGDVRVDYFEWWQQTPPTVPDPTEMHQTKISIPRRWSSNVEIEACLHGEFTVSEPLIVGRIPFAGFTDPALKDVTYAVPATNYPDWPDYVIKLDVKRLRGGYHCIKRKIYKPQAVLTGTRVGTPPWRNEHYIFSNYDNA